MVDNHWTRNGKWPDLWSYWKWTHSCFSFYWCFPPLPPTSPLFLPHLPLCTQLDFLGTRPNSRMGPLNPWVSVNMLPSCWAVPWSCWGRNWTGPGVSLCRSSQLIAVNVVSCYSSPCYYRRWNLPLLCHVYTVGCYFGMNVEWRCMLNGGAGPEDPAAFRTGAGKDGEAEMSQGATIVRRFPLGPPVDLNTGQTVNQVWGTWMPRTVYFLSSFVILFFPLTAGETVEWKSMVHKC